MDNKGINTPVLITGLSAAVMFGVNPMMAASLVVSAILLIWSGWPQRTVETWLTTRENSGELLSVIAVFGAVASVIHALITH